MLVIAKREFLLFRSSGNIAVSGWRVLCPNKESAALTPFWGENQNCNLWLWILYCFCLL